MRLGQLDVGRQRLAVEPFGPCDRPGAFGERLGQVTARQFDADATGQQRACVVAIIEQRLLAIVGRRENPADVAGDALQRHQ